MSLRFGTSGIPLSTRRPGTEHGIRRARELGLDCLELGRGNGVRMSGATADRIARARVECGLELTAHALHDVRASGWVICETPAMEADALRLQRFYRRIA